MKRRDKEQGKRAAKGMPGMKPVEPERIVAELKRLWCFWLVPEDNVRYRVV